VRAKNVFLPFSVVLEHRWQTQYRQFSKERRRRRRRK
jgi:hypothetical protein